VTAAAKRAFEAVGTTMLINDGAPGQTLDHLHVHVIPRFDDDKLMIPNADSASTPRQLRAELASMLRAALS
jgi:diadenosine tetraphosphate (Ap4A) HIT family hydrolase